MIKMRETVSPRPKGRGFKRDGSRNRTKILFLNKNEIFVSFFVSQQRIFRIENSQRYYAIHPLTKVNGFLAIFI